MTNKNIFRIWAPVNKRWVEWVRPVPFVEITSATSPYTPSGIILPGLSLNKNNNETAIIVDLPGPQSIEAGILLAQQYGYRPIPIYNGTQEQKGARATSDNHSILGALVWGASILSDVELNDNAPPVFLTDTNRLQRYKLDISVFDNSWDVYHQDLPTEEYFLNHGITKLLVISEKMPKDLRKIFAGHSKKKLSVYLTNGYEEPKCIRKGR